MSDLLELLPEYVLGVLSADEAEHVRDALERDMALRSEHDRVQEAIANLSFFASAAPSPSPSLRDRLLGRVRGADRFLPFVDALARLFEVSAATARRYLDAIDDSSGWATLTPEIAYRDFAGGPSTSGARVGMVRVAAGAMFPMHRHRGVERVLVLQGATRDGERIFRSGEQCENADGTQHTMPALGSAELIYAVVVDDVEVEGFSSP